MGKLITPVQHELVLDGFNELRPLQLQKNVQRVVSLPVLNADPANVVTARGKLLRCQGSGVVSSTKQWGQEGGEFVGQNWTDAMALHQYIGFTNYNYYYMALLKINPVNCECWMSDFYGKYLFEFETNVTYSFFLFGYGFYIKWKDLGANASGQFRTRGFFGGDIQYGR